MGMFVYLLDYWGVALKHGRRQTTRQRMNREMDPLSTMVSEKGGGVVIPTTRITINTDWNTALPRQGNVIWIKRHNTTTETTSPSTPQYIRGICTSGSCLLSPPLACMYVGNPALDAVPGPVESPYLGRLSLTSGNIRLEHIDRLRRWTSGLGMGQQDGETSGRGRERGRRSRREEVMRCALSSVRKREAGNNSLRDERRP
ncbi:hypothetical protein B0T18DRAFT_49813 [Schizothecium vesticola]|uniref:Uncharacterized protein n=1 Tax=Schizothecium vesticola TaxID=314040 RepID=A0AA40FC00_9PEZI|nr:hypothetical protein B0T18DRAFT_49813 [Schizothecium vesticola]